MQKYNETYLKFIKTLGKKVQNARLQRGYSQKELSVLTGFSEKYIKNLELGRATGTTLGRIIKIAKVLKVKIYELC